MTGLITADAIEAASALANLDGWTWGDLGPKLTCSEAEVLYAFLCAWGNPGCGDVLMRSHAEDDDCGDRHIVDDTNTCGWGYNDDVDEG